MVIILVPASNRIGQGIEFDYRGRMPRRSLADLTPSWSTATRKQCGPLVRHHDRLYFEPLTFEDVLEIFTGREEDGPGQGRYRPARWPDPLSLAARLKAAGVPILGTTPESIDWPRTVSCSVRSQEGGDECPALALP